MSQIQQVCERINETFVVKCVEQVRVIQEPIQVVMSEQPVPPESFWSFGLPELINVVLVVISLGLAYWGFKIARDAASIANNANQLVADEAEANRKHNKLSVRPALDLYFKIYSERSRMSVKLKNSGLGPAVIRRIEVFRGNKLVLNTEQKNSTDWRAYLMKMFDLPDSHFANNHIHMNFYEPRSIIAANEETVLLGINLQSQLDGFVAEETFQNMKVTIYYESLYEERFEISKVIKEVDSLITKN